MLGIRKPPPLPPPRARLPSVQEIYLSTIKLSLTPRWSSADNCIRLPKVSTEHKISPKYLSWAVNNQFDWFFLVEIIVMPHWKCLFWKFKNSKVHSYPTAKYSINSIIVCLSTWQINFFNTGPLTLKEASIHNLSHKTLLKENKPRWNSKCNGENKFFSLKDVSFY